MDTNIVLQRLSTMGYSYEVQSNTPGIAFDDGFKSYNELPPCSDMLAKLDNGDYADRHSCRSVNGRDNG